jgi:hypothetical protein
MSAILRGLQSLLFGAAAAANPRVRGGRGHARAVPHRTDWSVCLQIRWFPSRGADTPHRICGLLLAALLVPGLARADTEVCIESTAALYAAFAAVDADDTGTVLFKLRTGTYTLTSDLELGYRSGDGDPNRSHGKLTIRGGYGPGCTSQSSALGGTTLVAASGTPAVDIELNNNSLELSTISAQNVDLFVGNWLCYTHHFDEGNTITIRQVRLLNTRIGLTSACHSHAFRNSLITSRDGNANDAAVSYGAYWRPDITPQSFVVVGSTLRAGSLRLSILGDGDLPELLVKLQNSVFENDGAEVVIDGGNLYAIRNRFDSASVVNGSFVQDDNNLAAPPQLQSSGVPQNASPLVNAGTRFVDGGLPAIDLAANPREVGTRPDIGAFETAVDNIAVYEVTNTSSSGTGSLAQAVASANATNNAQTITFDITGPCPRVITLTATLRITDAVRIRGYTQPGTVLNTLDFGTNNGEPCIVLRPGPGVADAIDFDSSEPGDDLEVQNIGFSGFTGAGVTLRSGDGHRIAGLQFGASVGLFALEPVTFGIRVLDDASQVEIGGPDARSSNLIGDTSIAVQLDGPGGNLVLGNAIGSRGLDDLGNVVGVNIVSPSNTVEGNRIVLSDAPNIILSGADAQSNVIRDNTIAAGGSHGVSITNGANNNRIGPDNSVLSNDGNGVLVVSGARNQVRENRIGSSGGLGIDLGNDGVTLNDDDPLVSPLTGLANRLQNFPELDTLERFVLFGQPFAILDGSLRTTPGSYAVDVFRVASCDASGHGEGNVLIGSATVDVACTILQNGQCTEPFELTLADDDFDETDSIALTATGTSGTSEFSRCFPQNPDFSISIDNGTATVAPGALTQYTIVARNAGFSPTGGERVRYNFPAACTSGFWTCVGASGGSCTASGVGNINDTAVNLPVGARVTYTATCAVASNATGTLSSTATITSARDDLTPADNTDSDVDPIVAPQLSVGAASVVEGDTGATELAFPVSLSPASQATVTVDFATSAGTASAGNDYTSVSGTLTFAVGATSRIIRVPVAGDRTVEADETVRVALSNASNATLDVATATGTIRNDDTATLSIGNATANEGNTGTTNLSFTVRLSNPVQGDVSARVDTLDGNDPDPSRNATLADNDYLAVTAGNITLVGGVTARSTAVGLVGDTTPEANESFRVQLSGLTIPAGIPAGAITLGDPTATGTLRNDDGETTVTTILDDTPDPSAIGQPYVVSVEVSGTTQSPAGTVTVSDGDASCAFTLTAGAAPNSSGSCELASTTPGAHMLTATFVPASSAFAASSATEPHQVTAGDPVFADGFE